MAEELHLSPVRVFDPLLEADDLPSVPSLKPRQKRHETLEKCQRGSRWLAGRMTRGCRFCPAVWPSPIDLAGAAVPPDRSYRRRSCARVIRVDVALARAAGSRHRALDQRKVGAILIAASPHGDEVHANRKIWIIRLSPGSPCCRDHSCRQNSQGQNTHRNLSRIASKPSEPNNRTVMLIPVNTLSRTSLRKPMARGNSYIARLIVRHGVVSSPTLQRRMIRGWSPRSVNGGPKTSQLAAQKSANPARRFLTVWMW